MESFFKITTGLLLLLISMAFLYRPGIILRFHTWVRVLLLNDAHVLHYRRRWGLLALLGSILFLYSGLLNLNLPADPAREDSSLREGYRAFKELRYADAVAVAKQRLMEDPSDVHAEFLLGQASRHLRRARP